MDAQHKAIFVDFGKIHEKQVEGVFLHAVLPLVGAFDLAHAGGVAGQHACAAGFKVFGFEAGDFNGLAQGDLPVDNNDEVTYFADQGRKLR